MARLSIALCLALSLCCPLAAQNQPKRPPERPPAKAPATEPPPAPLAPGPLAPMVAPSTETAALITAATESAQRALTEGRREAARAHSIDALALDHAHAPAWRVLLEIDKADPDLLAARTWQAGAALWGPTGAQSIADAALRALVVKDATLVKLLNLRNTAAKELAELARSLDKKGATSAANLLTARHMTTIAALVCGLAPELLASTAPGFAGFPEHPALDIKTALAALKECADAALSAKDAGGALAMGRLLQAFATQARLQGLRGPRPEGMQPVGLAGANIIGRAREQLREKLDKDMPTLEALEALDASARARFTADHADSGNPGVVLSPEKLYRVETTCGCDTLIGAAQTVELHHRRLAKWFGSDPFTGRQGTLRIVPTAAELEAEGTPHWWAGGFQGGDITTLRFAHGTIEGLGHTITHELTHRFDQALFPGMPSWLVEGRAVWTGGAYGASADDEFVEKHVSIGSVETAFMKGYGNPDNLKKLIEGTIEEYRDNYSAGYALMVYLRTAPPDGEPLHAAALQRFMRDCATDKRPMMERFIGTFCHPEGAGALPKNLKEFAAGFAVWLQGFYWQSRAPFLEHYVTRITAPWHAGYVYDKPTWHKARDHAEPFFGQYHCATLGEFLLARGKPREAALSLAAAALVDEPDAAFAQRAAESLRTQGEAGAAWALLASAHQRFPERVARTASPAPLRSRLVKTIGYLQELKAAAASETAARPRLAQLLCSDARQLAQSLGEEAPAAVASDQHAPEDVPWALGAAGFEETELTGFDEHRVPALWSALPDGLIVGRKQDRDGTGTTDRRAHQRDAFVRGHQRVAGGYWRFSCRVQALTSFISGALVFSDTRRDRNARLRFSCGDFMYSIGRKEEQAKLESVHTGFDGLFEREGPLRSAVPDRQIKFPTPVADFRIELLVAGNCATAFVNGELVGSYTRPDGAPLEGHLGFASGQGAFRVLEPRLQRMDSAGGTLSASANASAGAVAYVDPVQSGTLGDPLNKSVNGLPRGPRGALVLWVPTFSGGDPDNPSGVSTHEIVRAIEALQHLHAASALDLPLSVVVPAACSDDAKKAFGEAVSKPPSVAKLIEHQWKRGLAEVPMPDGRSLPVMALCWIDSNGILRSVDPFDGRVELWPHGVLQWMKGSGLTILE